MKNIGIIPAAGQGSRLGSIGFSKELFPIFSSNGLTCLDRLISAMKLGNVDHIRVVVNPKKMDIVKYLKLNTKSTSPSMSYKIVSSPSLVHSIFYGIDQLNLKVKEPCNIYFGLPDTMWEPENAFKVLNKAMLEQGYDICFGLFDSQPSCEYDSVLLNKDTITKIAVKNIQPLSKWFWGIGVMTLQTYQLLKIKLTLQQYSVSTELLMGEFINSFIQSQEIRVGGVRLKNNRYFDLGTPQRIMDYFSQQSKQMRQSDK